MVCRLAQIVARGVAYRSRSRSAWRTCIPGKAGFERIASRVSSMRTAWPTARPPHTFFKFRAHPFDMLPPCLGFLDGDGPADPLVARKRRNVFPGRQRFLIGRERLSEISRKAVYDSSCDANGCHRVVLRAKRSSI